MGDGCGLVGFVAATALRNARKSVPVPTKKPLCELETMSVKPPLGSVKRTAIPRGEVFGSASLAWGLPVPSDNRTVTGTGPPARCAALLTDRAAGAGVKLPVR